jgi:hypothetical protein
MALNEDHIYIYDFKSRSNANWNFQLQFVKGKYALLGTTKTALPPIFVDGFSILSDLPDNLPFGKQKASLLTINLDFTILDGDFLVLKNWFLLGGVYVGGELCPNQWRILSNGGRGASDVTYDVVEFWGCQDVLPEQSLKFEYGKLNNLSLDILSIDNLLLNSLRDFYNIFNSASTTYNNKYFYEYRFDGVNSGSQNVELRSRNQFINGKDYGLASSVDIVSTIVSKMETWQLLYLRNWINVIDYDNTYITFWDFFKQTYDLTTQAGASIGSDADVLHLTKIYDTITGAFGGLISDKSKEGFYQFKNCNDLLNSLCEQFISKLTFKYNITSPRLTLTFDAPYDSVSGTSINLTSSDITGEITLKRGVYAIAESTVSYKGYKQNQNKNTYKIYGSLKQDSYDNKALFTTNVQIAEIQDWANARLSHLPYIIIQHLYYYDTTFNEFYLTHANNSLILDNVNSKVISNESITGEGIDPADDKSSGNKEINRQKIIEWANVRYNKSGLNYVQSKAYASIMNDKAMLLECEVLDYLIKPRDVGEKIVSDLSTILNLPSEWFFTTNHVLTSCEIDLLTGISKIKLFIRGE